MLDLFNQFTDRRQIAFLLNVVSFVLVAEDDGGRRRCLRCCFFVLFLGELFYYYFCVFCFNVQQVVFGLVSQPIITNKPNDQKANLMRILF